MGGKKVTENTLRLKLKYILSLSKAWFEITPRNISLLHVWITRQSKQQYGILLVGRTFIILSQASTCVYSQIYNLPCVINDDGILRIMTEFFPSPFWQ